MLGIRRPRGQRGSLKSSQSLVSFDDAIASASATNGDLVVQGPPRYRFRSAFSGRKDDVHMGHVRDTEYLPI